MNCPNSLRIKLGISSANSARLVPCDSGYEVWYTVYYTRKGALNYGENRQGSAHHVAGFVTEEELTLYRQIDADAEKAAAEEAAAKAARVAWQAGFKATGDGWEIAGGWLMDDYGNLISRLPLEQPSDISAWAEQVMAEFCEEGE